MADVVGSAAFELRATKDKIPADLEAARQEILAATKKTEAELSGVVGTGISEGNKKAAASFESPKVAANDASAVIKSAMQAAGSDIATSVKAGSDKAKAELDSLAAKAREVQAIPKAWVPDDAYRKATNAPYQPIQPLASPTPNISAPALKDTSSAAKEAGEALDTVGKKGVIAEGGLARLAGGALGLWAALGVGIGVIGLLVGAILKLGQDGIKLGDDIAKSAKGIGIGTDALQTWRFVAQQSGADAKDADRALDSFATKLSQATAGTSKEAVKAFKLIQIGPDQLKSFKSTEDAIEVVTDRIKGLKSEADRVAVAEALGLGPLSNALRDNAVDVAALRDEAVALGVVMDQELIKRASAAQGELDTLSQVIDVQLKSAFIDIAPALITAIGLVAQLATALSDAMDGWRQLDQRTSRGLKSERDRIIVENTQMFSRYGQNMPNRPSETPVVGASGSAAGPGAAFAAAAAGPSVRDRWNDNVRRLGEIDRLLAERATVAAPERQDRPAGGTVTLPPPRAARKDHSAEQETRRSERVEAEINRLRARALGIVDREMQTVQQRFDIERAQVETERNAEETNLKSRLARKDITSLEFEQLTLINEQTAILEDRVAKDILGRDLADERLAKERALTDLTVDLLSIQASGARTATERARLERQLLQMAQRRAREDLETELSRTPGLSEDDKRNRRGRLADVQRAQSEAIRNQNLTPLQAWRDASLKSIGEVNEAYAGIAARGLDALNDGIVDAIMNSKNLGDVFSSVAKQIMADLLAISVRKGITEPLANMLFGGEDGGGATGKVSAVSNIVKSFLGSFGRRALGGPVSAGTPYVVGENRAELFVPSVPGTILPSIGGAAGGGMGRQVAPIHFDMRGAVMTADLLQQAQSIATATGGMAFTSARQAVPQDMAKTSRYSRGRR